MRIARALRAKATGGDGAPQRYDSWLEQIAADRLAEIDASCAAGGGFELFADLDVDLWALLLTKEYDAYPGIRALLPDMPGRSLQELWNGASGLPLAAMGAVFYGKLRERFRRHGQLPLSEARVLDFGCGWGRLTRFLARDVAPGRLCGCDPAQMILDVCEQTRVPAVLRRSDFVPARLPFEEPFDLAFAFSVFTHLSEPAHEASLRALHAALRPDALLVVTVRPPGYLHVSPLLRPVPIAPGEARYLFVPHAADDSHPQYGGGEMTYGETVITLPYIRERWAPLFELLDVDLLLDDLHQVMITLRRR
jgi:SAM-dependent methyltransferase